jgi:hypothetical protein
MTRDEFVGLLNDDLSTEYQSIVQYNLHISTITGAEYVSTVAELTRHLSKRLTTLGCSQPRWRSSGEVRQRRFERCRRREHLRRR